jgi:hypothetical protein
MVKAFEQRAPAAHECATLTVPAGTWDVGISACETLPRRVTRRLPRNAWQGVDGRLQIGVSVS